MLAVLTLKDISVLMMSSGVVLGAALVILYLKRPGWFR
jgi:hypothetical protein